MSQPSAIFVYGTLQRGEERQALWPHPPTHIDEATTQGVLYDLGPYPALLSGDGWVRGELWHLRPEHLAETLRALDVIEGFGQGGADWYVRRVVACRRLADDTLQNAYAYFFAQGSLLVDKPVVPAEADGAAHWRRNGMTVD